MKQALQEEHLHLVKQSSNTRRPSYAMKTIATLCKQKSSQCRLIIKIKRLKTNNNNKLLEKNGNVEQIAEMSCVID